MFKKFLTMIGTYTVCVFIHKVSTSVIVHGAPIVIDALDDLKPKK